MYPPSSRRRSVPGVGSPGYWNQDAETRLKSQQPSADELEASSDEFQGRFGEAAGPLSKRYTDLLERGGARASRAGLNVRYGGVMGGNTGARASSMSSLRGAAGLLDPEEARAWARGSLSDEDTMRRQVIEQGNNALDAQRRGALAETTARTPDQDLFGGVAEKRTEAAGTIARDQLRKNTVAAAEAEQSGYFAQEPKRQDEAFEARRRAREAHEYEDPKVTAARIEAGGRVGVAEQQRKTDRAASMKALADLTNRAMAAGLQPKTAKGDPNPMWEQYQEARDNILRGMEEPGAEGEKTTTSDELTDMGIPPEQHDAFARQHGYRLVR